MEFIAAGDRGHLIMSLRRGGNNPFWWRNGFFFFCIILFVGANVAADACRQNFGAYAAAADFITGHLLKGRRAVDRSFLETGSFVYYCISKEITRFSDCPRAGPQRNSCGFLSFARPCRSPSISTFDIFFFFFCRYKAN